MLSLCISHLDYCNSILYGLPNSTIKKIQHIQNMCARLVLRRTKWDSAADCLSSLHWLPIKQRIKFKLCVLTYKLLHRGPSVPSGAPTIQEYTEKSEIFRPTLTTNPKDKAKNLCQQIFQGCCTHRVEQITQ